MTSSAPFCVCGAATDQRCAFCDSAACSEHATVFSSRKREIACRDCIERVVCIECGEPAAWRCDCGSFACERHSVERSTSRMLERPSYFHEIQYSTTFFRVCAKCLREAHKAVVAKARAEEDAVKVFQRFLELAAPLGFPGTVLFYRREARPEPTKRELKAFMKAHRKLDKAAFDRWLDRRLQAENSTIRGWDIRPHTTWHGAGADGSAGRQILLTDGSWACCWAPHGLSLILDEDPRNSQVPDLVEIAPLLMEIAQKNGIPALES